MAPIRRYLRITQYSVLEVRIYLDNPADAHRWLLKLGDPALPRVIEAVRPLVLPKLREENARARKGGKKKGVKDVVVKGRLFSTLKPSKSPDERHSYEVDDFEVSIFLTELSTSHAILSKHKTFVAKNGENDIGTKDQPLNVDDEPEPIIRPEEDDEEVVELHKIPSAKDAEEMSDSNAATSDAESPAFQTQSSPTRKRNGEKDENETEMEEDRNDDEKKKMGFKTTYDGFRIHGRILCLVVKRKGIVKGKVLEGGTGQAMMEDWISSTQAAEGRMVDD